MYIKASKECILKLLEMIDKFSKISEIQDKQTVITFIVMYKYNDQPKMK